MNENGNLTEYEYDGAGRLVTEKNDDTKTTYFYDKYNNRTDKIIYDTEDNLLSRTKYEYDFNNRLLNETTKTRDGHEAHSDYSYDNNGNLILKTLSATAPGNSLYNNSTLGINTGSNYAIYTYDAFNRMTAMTNGNTSASYIYDGNGLRQQKTVNGVTTQFVLDGANVVAEKTGGVNTYYNRGIGLISRVTSGEADYYLSDYHGSITKLTDNSGNIVADYSYDAFGNEKTDNTDTNPFRYCGEYVDAESGLVYLRARYYDANIGRFTSEDPIKDGVNWYVYCGGNPVNAWDPSGLEDVLLGDIMRKNGATVTVNKNSSWGIKWGLKSITVTLNDITKEYTSLDYRIVNDKAVIDNSILMKDFELDDTQSTHQPGDYDFSREEDAALAFGLKYGQRSKDERQEYGAVINKDSNGNFCFTNVTNSTQSAAEQGKTIIPMSGDHDPLRNHVNITADISSVAMIHTHWRSDGNLNFSNPNDYNGGLNVSKLYLVNRNGELYYSKKTTVWSGINGWTLGKKLFKIR